MTTQTVSFEASEKLKNEIKRRADQDMRTQSSFLRKALNDYLNLSPEDTGDSKDE